MPSGKNKSGKRFLSQSSLRLRLTLLFLGIFGTTLILFSVLLYNAFIRTYESEFDADLFNHTVDVAQNMDINLFGDLSVKQDIVSGSGKIFPFQLGQSYLQIRSSNTTIMARSLSLGSTEIPLGARELREVRETGVSFSTIYLRQPGKSIRERVGTYRVVHYLVDRPPFKNVILQVAVPRTMVEREKTKIFTFFLFSIPLTLFIATLGGLYLSQRAFAPVLAIIQKAKNIRASDLSQRVPVPNDQDELTELATTVNDLLDRIQTAFVSQEQFIADASHQLKTPLAIMKGELDVLSSRPRTPEEMSEFTLSARQEIETMIKTVEDLLLLARVTSGASAIEHQGYLRKSVRLDELLLEAIGKLERLARPRDIKIRCNVEGEDFLVQGDAALLLNLVQNLIENAIKFSPAGGIVDVRLTSNGDAHLVVRDQGPGIPVEMQKKVFDRFFRAPQVSASASAPNAEATIGSGLGLPIARKIAELHKGSLNINSITTSPGAEFVVRLPIIKSNHT